jgi:hypothetical protein
LLCGTNKEAAQGCLRVQGICLFAQNVMQEADSSRSVTGFTAADGKGVSTEKRTAYNL